MKTGTMRSSPIVLDLATKRRQRSGHRTLELSMQWDLLGVSILRCHCLECHSAVNPPLSDNLHQTEAEGDMRGIIPSKGTSDWGRSTLKVGSRIPGCFDNRRFVGSVPMVHSDERLGRRSDLSIGHTK